MGAYIRVKGDRYIAGFALIDDTTVAETQSFPAPPDESQAGQLGELCARATDLIGRWAPELFALKISELQKQAQALVAHRAEGVVLGAAGRHRALDVTTWSGRSLWKPAGLTARAKEHGVHRRAVLPRLARARRRRTAPSGRRGDRRFGRLELTLDRRGNRAA